MRLTDPHVSQSDGGPLTPASLSFDPFDADYLSNPYPLLASLRSSEPVFYSPNLKSWVVTRYETLRSILRDPRRFSARIASDPIKPLCPMARTIIQNSNFNVPPLLVNNDPPEHTRLRRFMAGPLNAARVQSLESGLRSSVSTLVDRMLSGKAPTDLVRALTWEVPALVLFELIGIPVSDMERVKGWASSRVVMTWGRPSDEEQIRLAQGAVEYYEYACELVKSKLANPADDYTSDLIRQRAGDDGKATLHEITVNIFNLLFAGHETTSNAAANMFLTLLSSPERWQEVCDGKNPIAKVVEESLRYDSPLHAWHRLAKEDVELDGQKIPAGSRLLIVMAAGNRDPEHFESPDEFCPGRSAGNQHLAFGMGIHSCLGAPLARQELAVMLETLSARAPTLRLVGGQKLEYTPNTSLRGFRELQVTW
jgi:cytochrome P450